LFGTNPIAMAAPTAREISVLIDSSTSIMAGEKIITATKKGEPTPMVDILAGVLTGGGFADGVKSMYKDFTQPANVGHFLVAVNVEAFMPGPVFFDRMHSLVEGIKSAKKRERPSEIHVPGERKFRIRRERSTYGNTLDEQTLKELQQVGSQCSIEFPL
jgi:LDH2 family malate/lactate/ureidoglycolate dehydrogenase